MEVFNPNSGKKGLTAASKSDDPEDMMLKGGFDPFAEESKPAPAGFDQSASDLSGGTPMANMVYVEKMPFLKQVLCSVIPPAYYKYKGITKEGYVFFIRIVTIILMLVVALLLYIKYSEIGQKEGILDTWVEPNFQIKDGMLTIYDDEDHIWEGDIFPYYPAAFPHVYANENIKEFEAIENDIDLNNVLNKYGVKLQNTAHDMLILSKTNYIKAEGTDWKIVSYEDLGKEVINKHWMIQRYEDKYRIFVIIGLILFTIACYLVIFLGYRLIAFIYSLICLLLCTLMKKKLTELNRMKAGVYAMVPSFAVASLYILMPSGLVSAAGFTYAMIGAALLPIVIIIFAIPNLE